ncbi:MAG: hypothetical protein QMC03_04035 [Flavobacteriales bacterium]|jgi:uncharacterized membrane protein|tara:strand:+ start:905 stop:1291 length:387 start_codon:yes stop_codon:yes gene_type:complete
MKKKGIIVAISLVALAYFGYQYMYQEHRNILKEKASLSITSTELYKAFSTPSHSNTEYINAIIEFQGILTSVEKDLIVIQPNIVCKLDSNFSSANLNAGDTLLLKGRCIGFDDLFMEVKMDNVSFIKR